MDEVMREPAHKKRLSLAKCHKCGRVTPYRLKGLELYLKTTVRCKKCGTPIPIGERLDDDLNLDLWQADVLERTRRTYDQCKILLTTESA